MYSEVDNNNIEIGIYDIYFKQLKSKHARLQFIHDLFINGATVAIERRQEKFVPESIDLLHVGDSYDPIHGFTYMCIDSKNIMHVSANRLVAIKRLISSFSLVGYILTVHMTPKVKIKHPDCKYYKAYNIHNQLNNTLPISLS